MRKFLLLFLAASFLFINCDNSSENPIDDGPVQNEDEIADEEETVEEDNTPPEITISEIPEVIEVPTELSLTISDESEDVTTSIRIDGEEVFTTTGKNFTFSINPFDYTIGNKVLEVRTTDSAGNESNSELLFELKKLLIRIPNALGASELDLVDVYLAVNDLSGNMIAYEKVEMDGVLDFFADDSFVFQDIVLTRYLIAKPPQSFQFISSISDLHPGTILPTEEERGTLREMPGLDPLKNIDISVTSPYLPVLRSFNSQLLSFSGFSGDYSIRYNNAVNLERGEVLYSFPSLPATPISEYQYVIIDNLSKVNYEEGDFKTPSAFADFLLPDFGDSYSLRVEAFYDEGDFQNYRFRQIFSNSDNTMALSNRTLTIPVLDEFEVFQRELAMFDNSTKKRLQISQRGIGPDFFVPTFDITNEGQSVRLSGNYDYVEFHTSNVIVENGVGAVNMYFWDFKARPTTESFKIPYGDFELPPEVVQELEIKSQGVDPFNFTMNSFECRIFDFEAEGSYEDILFFRKDFADGPREDQYSLTLDLN